MKPSMLRRVGQLILSLLVAVLVIAVLVAWLAPASVARSTLIDLLDSLRIEHDGIETLDLNLLTGTASAGPVAFGPVEEQLRLERIAVSVSRAQFLDRRVRVNRLELVGVDMDLRREKSGEIGLVGTTINRLLGQVNAEEASTEEPGDPWDLGLDNFLMSDSRILLTDFSGGELELEVERLELSDLRTWDASRPTTFRLIARLNGIEIDYTGEVTPFSDPLRIGIEGKLRRLTYDSIARFAASKYDQGIEGVISADLYHEIVLHSDGRMDGRTQGEVLLEAFWLDTPKGEEIGVATSRLLLDLTHSIPESGVPEVTGSATLEIGAAELRTALGEQIRIEGARLSGEAMKVRDISNEDAGAFAKGLRARLALGGEGDIPSLADLIVRFAVAVAEEIQSRDLEITGDQGMSVVGVVLSIPGEGGGEALTASADSVSFDVSGLTAEIVGDDSKLEGGFKAGIEGYSSRAAVSGTVVTSAIEQLALRVERAAAVTIGAETTVEFDLDLQIAGIRSGGEGGQRLDIDQIALISPGLDVHGNSDLRGAANGPLSLVIEDLGGIWPQEGGGTLVLNGRRLKLSLDEVDIERRQNNGASVSGGLELAGWALEQEGGALRAAFDALAVQLPLSTVSFSDQGLTIKPGRLARAIRSEAEADDEEPAAKDIAVAPEVATVPVKKPDDVVPAASLEPLPDIAEVDEVAETMPSPEFAPMPPEKLDDGMARAAAATAESVEAETDSFSVTIENLTAALPTAGGVLNLGGDSAEVELTTFDFASESEKAFLAGRLKFKGWQWDHGGSGLRARLAAARLDTGGLDLDLAGASPGLTGSLAIRLDGLAAAAADANGREWELAAESLQAEVRHLALTEKATELAGDVRIVGVRVAEAREAPNMFAVAELTVVGAALGAGDAVLIDAVRIDGLDVDLNERLIKEALEGGGPDASGAEAPAIARGSTLPPFRLGALTIGGGSRLAITDIVAGDLFRVDVGLEQLQIGPIDLADPTERTAFDLRLSINEITSISLAGTARPFSKPPDLDIDALIDNLPVAPFSPYLEQQLGLVLLGGALSSRLDATAEDGALNGHVTMILRDFQLEPMSREADEAFRDKFVVSPNYVVSLLRDGDGDIDLDFPISGTIDDPDVDLSSLTGKAVGGALVSLIPFNWFDDDEWETKDVTVAFPPGSAKLAAGLHDLLDHAGRKLKADTETPVLLCGIATDADIAQLRGVDAGDLRGARQATREEITAVMEIAAAREAAIREFLSVNHSVIGSRIGQCQTEYIPGMSLPPRAVFRVAVD